MKIKIKVKPNSKQQEIETADDGSLIIRLKSPPVDGKANRELVTILAKKYRVAKNQIKIKSGANGKNKLIEIN
ncbi:DUF167 domain-containing protein [Myxosarcina sp. GI1(2024)]